MTTTVLARYKPFLILVSLLLLTLFVYAPGLTGDFIFDDVINITLNYRSHLQTLDWESIKTTWSSGIASSIGRPMSMLSFGLNYYFAGMDPWFFKLTNILIHLATGLAIYFLTLELLKIQTSASATRRFSDSTLALFVTAFWVLHPLQVSTVLYIVQRMTQLAAMFSVLALLVYCRQRQKTDLSYSAIIGSHAAVGGLIVAGILNKENAALTVFLLALIELCLYRLRVETPRQRLFQLSFLIFYALIPAMFISGYLILKPQTFLADYEIRTFTLSERLLTESRIVWDYVSWILVPDSREFVFFHDNYPVSTDLLSPPTTLAAVLSLGLVVALALGICKKLPYLSFGIGFFFIGHLMESTIWPLELVFEHRNYLPSYGLLFGLIATLGTSPLTPYVPKQLLAVPALFLLFFGYSTLSEVHKWAITPVHMLEILRVSPKSYRINNSVGYTYILLWERTNDNQYLEEASAYFSRATELDRNAFNSSLALVRMDSMLGKPISQALIDDVIQRIRKKAISGSELIELINTTRCIFRQECPQVAAFLGDIYTAIGQNGFMPVGERQSLLGEIGSDIYNTYQRPQDALALYYYAASLSDTVTINDIRIIYLEGQLGNTAAAKAQLQKALAKQGANGRFAKALEDMSRQLP